MLTVSWFNLIVNIPHQIVAKCSCLLLCCYDVVEQSEKKRARVGWDRTVAWSHCTLRVSAGIGFFSSAQIQHRWLVNNTNEVVDGHASAENLAFQLIKLILPALRDTPGFNREEPLQVCVNGIILLNPLWNSNLEPEMTDRNRLVVWLHRASPTVVEVRLSDLQKRWLM